MNYAARQWHIACMTPQPGHNAHGPHSAGKPASNRWMRHWQLPQPLPAAVSRVTSAMVSASPSSIAVRMLDAVT
jgi:hypothetical protein